MHKVPYKKDVPILYIMLSHMYQSKREMFGLNDNNPLGWAAGTIIVGDKQQPYITKPGGGIGHSGNIRIYPRLGIASISMQRNRCEC